MDSLPGCPVKASQAWHSRFGRWHWREKIFWHNRCFQVLSSAFRQGALASAQTCRQVHPLSEESEHRLFLSILAQIEAQVPARWRSAGTHQSHLLPHAPGACAAQMCVCVSDAPARCHDISKVPKHPKGGKQRSSSFLLWRKTRR